MITIELIVLAVVLVIAVFFLYREISVIKKKLYNLENDKLEIEKLKRSVTLIHSQIPNIKFLEQYRNNIDNETNIRLDSTVNNENLEHDDKSEDESDNESEDRYDDESDNESEDRYDDELDNESEDESEDE